MRPLVILSICAAVALAAPAPAAAAPPAGTPSQAQQFLRAFVRLEDSLRVAIERQPEGLTISLDASERVCALGAGAEERGEAPAAAADWSTLTQLVEQLDEPGLRGVERAFRQATSTLDEVAARFARVWRAERARVHALGAAAAQVKRGIRLTVSGVQPLRTAFAAWKDHRCEGALAAIETSKQAVPAGIAAISRGMERLLALADWGAAGR